MLEATVADFVCSIMLPASRCLGVSLFDNLSIVSFVLRILLWLTYSHRSIQRALLDLLRINCPSSKGLRTGISPRITVAMELFVCWCCCCLFVLRMILGLRFSLRFWVLDWELGSSGKHIRRHSILISSYRMLILSTWWQFVFYFSVLCCTEKLNLGEEWKHSYLSVTPVTFHCLMLLHHSILMTTAATASRGPDIASTQMSHFFSPLLNNCIWWPC